MAEGLKLNYVRLVPDTAAAAASGGTVGSVDLGGRKDLIVRCINMRGIARVEAMIGRNYFEKGADISKDFTRDQFAEVIAMALELSQPPFTIDDVYNLGPSEYPKLVEVGICFLLAVALSPT